MGKVHIMSLFTLWLNLSPCTGYHMEQVHLHFSDDKMSPLKYDFRPYHTVSQFTPKSIEQKKGKTKPKQIKKAA